MIDFIIRALMREPGTNRTPDYAGFEDVVSKDRGGATRHSHGPGIAPPMPGAA